MSKSMTDATLLAHIAGALEPDPDSEVRAALHRSAPLRDRLARLRRTVEPPPSRIRIPPPGIFAGRQPFHFQAMTAAVMSGETSAEQGTDMHRVVVAPGDRFRLAIEHREDAEQWMHVVLERLEGAEWEVSFPEDEDDLVRLADLPTVDDGRRMLDLSAPTEPGRHRMALALVPINLRIDWEQEPDAERWSVLLAGLEDGTFAVAAVHVEVRA